jgi:hypothetical protein
MLLTVSSLLFVVALQAAAPAPVPATGLAVEGEEAEQFLLTAEVVDIEYFQTKAITRPRRATLSDGTRTLRAVFKDVDEDLAMEKDNRGRPILGLRDSYKHEIAAYELDKLLGTEMVPPCVERKVKGDKGCLCLWVEGSMTEWERSKEKFIQPPDVAAFNEQMHTIKLFMQLTWDTDYNNISNLLVGPDFQLWKVDSSRAFRPDKRLRREEGLTKFSRSVIEALRSLDPAEVQARMTPWLSKGQIKALLARGDAIVKLADKRVAKQGEEAVLYP